MAHTRMWIGREDAESEAHEDVTATHGTAEMVDVEPVNVETAEVDGIERDHVGTVFHAARLNDERSRI